MLPADADFDVVSLDTHLSDDGHHEGKLSVGSTGSSCGLSRQTSLSSFTTGSLEYVDPDQTLLFLDWDDSLFPTSQLIDRMGVCMSSADIPEDVARALLPWRKAVYEFLCSACSSSGRCVVVTNSRRPWVDKCVDRFVPELRPLLDADRFGVVYADEVFRRSRTSSQAPKTMGAQSSCGCLSGLVTWVQQLIEDEDMEDLLSSRHGHDMKDAKVFAMESEAASYFSKCPGGRWENVISLGDSWIEHDALLELADTCAGTPRECLRTKVITVPSAPSLCELTLSLQVSRLALPALIRFDGDLDIDLQPSESPVQSISHILSDPEMEALSLFTQASGQDQ